MHNKILTLFQIDPEPMGEEEWYHQGEPWSFWGDFVGGLLIVIIAIWLLSKLFDAGNKT